MLIENGHRLKYLEIKIIREQDITSKYFNHFSHGYVETEFKFCKVEDITGPVLLYKKNDNNVVFSAVPYGFICD